MKHILLSFFLLLSFNVSIAEDTLHSKFQEHIYKVSSKDYCKSHCTLNSISACSLIAGYEAQKACERRAEEERKQCLRDCEKK